MGVGRAGRVRSRAAGVGEAVGSLARPPAEPPLRLTRRGWCVLVSLGMAAVALAVLLLSALLGPGDELELAGGSGVVVQAGDTVWSIAASVAGGESDVRAVVDAIERLNDLEGSSIVPGQVLELP